MSFKMPKCKITVLKRTFNQDLVDEYLEDQYRPAGPCECFKDDQEFIIDPATNPEEFSACCAWAWADIRKDIMAIASGANIFGFKRRGTTITGCSDWFRPVYFKVERIE
ncbi:MAG: TIGR04076 family protein [Promethearchaeota archaeon]